MSNSPLSQAGALSDPSRFAALYVNRMFTGLYTQRNPLREAAVPHMYQHAGARFDSLIDGLNAELSANLTWKRRAGHSVYNSQTFPAIQRFYDFRTFTGSSETIHVMADTATDVYDATGPATKTVIFTKGVGAGRTAFQSVGNTLYMGTGVDQKKWRPGNSAEAWGTPGPANAPNNAPLGYLGAPTRYWAPNMQVQAGYAILDANGNIQLMTGQINTASHLTTTLSPTTLLNGWGNNAHVGDYEGGVSQGHQYPPLGLNNAVTLPYTNPGMAFDGANDTAAECSFTGTHQYAGCVWSFAYSGATPTGITLNILSEVPTGSGTRLRDAGIFYSLDGGSTWTKLYQSTTRGKQWNALTLSPSQNIANVQVMAFTDSHDNMAHKVYEINLVLNFDLISVTTTTGSQTTGTTTPNWNTNLFGNTTDGTAIWLNAGPVSQWQAKQFYSLSGPSAAIIDSNGNLQIVQTTGVSGAAQPTWATAPGATTTDGTVVWLNAGPGQTQATSGDGWTWVYAYHTVSGEVSTASPESQPTGPVLGSLGMPLSGVGSADTQVDYVRIYRTPDGGSTLLYAGQVANPGGGATWTYSDTNPDANLNVLIEAPVNHQNDVPPVGIQVLEYHMGRIWGAVGNTVVYTRTTSAVDGSPLSAFPPSNYFVFPSAVKRLWSSTQGLLVFTASDVYIILGRGTATDPFYSPGRYLQGYGLLSYDAFTVNGSTPQFMTAARKVVAFDPGAGVIEPGFPIGDEFESFNPAVAYLTFHEGASGDTALYVADGSTGWFRMAQTSPPETGIVWSPRATIAAGCSAVQSIETAPGVKDLLVGPGSSGPILRRDRTVNTDNTAAFAWFVDVGSIQLAQPGQIADIEFITAECVKVGKRPKVKVLLGEVSGTFENVPRSRQDPPLLPPSKTLYSDRYVLSQNHKPTLCRHFQLRFEFLAEDAANELLSYSIYGAVHNERS